MKYPHNRVLDSYFCEMRKTLIFRIGTKLYEQYKYWIFTFRDNGRKRHRTLAEISSKKPVYLLKIFNCKPQCWLTRPKEVLLRSSPGSWGAKLAKSEKWALQASPHPGAVTQVPVPGIKALRARVFLNFVTFLKSLGRNTIHLGHRPTLGAKPLLNNAPPPRLYHVGRGVIPQRRSESFMEGGGDSLKSCDLPNGPVSKTQAPPTQGAQAPSLVREVDPICHPKTWHRQIRK